MATSASRKYLRTVTFVALFAALIAGGTFISIPLPGSVPIVLANFFALLAGLVLGPVAGSAAVGLYLLAGVLGAPVFSGFQGGISRLVGPTGGFLIGYVCMALLAGLIAGGPSSTRGSVSRLRLIAAAGLGLLVVYVPGVLMLKVQANLDWPRAFVSGFLPFIPGDIIKGVVAVLIAPRLRRVLANLLDA